MDLFQILNILSFHMTGRKRPNHSKEEVPINEAMNLGKFGQHVSSEVM